VRKGSLFFVYWVVFGLFLAQFLVPMNAIAKKSAQVTISAIVLEHITYQKTANSYIISTNRLEGIKIYTKNITYTGNIIEIPKTEFDNSKNAFFITANF
jgi:hypothetical protein